MHFTSYSLYPLTCNLQFKSKKMNQSSPALTQGENFAVADLGAFSQLGQYSFGIPGKSFKFKGKVFLKELLNLTSAEISLNNLQPQQSIPFYHKHRLNEEIYIFVGGEGEFQVDSNILPLKEGTIVRVDPQGERCLRNTLDTVALTWIVVQSRADSHPENTIQDGFRVKKQVNW